MVEENDFYKEIIENLYDGVYFVDRDRKIIYWNKGAERITGYSSEQMVENYCRDNRLNHVTADGELLCTQNCPLAACMEDGKTREADVFLHHKLGHRVPVLVRVSPLRDKNDEIIGAVETFSQDTGSATVRGELTELRRNVQTDKLTGVGSRAFLEGRLRAVIAELAYRKESAVGLLFLDIDLFKHVNDNYGHPVGDQVLCMVAATLKQSLRQSDVVGRWGGDEFLAILYDVPSMEALQLIAEKTRMLLEFSHLDLESTSLTITASVGATLFLANDTTESVLQRADRLMYACKQGGGNRVNVG